MAILIIHLEVFTKIELYNFRALDKFLKVPKSSFRKTLQAMFLRLLKPKHALFC